MAATTSGIDPISDLYEIQEAPDQEILHQLIYEYLIHNCFGETAKSFGNTCQLISDKNRNEMDVDLDDSDIEKLKNGSLAIALETLDERKNVVELIRKGSLEEALRYFEDNFLNDLDDEDDNDDILFPLKCQQFVEYVKENTPRAVEYAQKELGQYMKSKFSDTLQDVLSLIAYPNPLESPVAHYMSQERREYIANLVNEYILTSYGLSQETSIEKIVKQATVVRSSLHADSLKEKKGPNQKKISSYPNNPRVQKSLIAAKYNGLTVDEVTIQIGVDNKKPEFLAKFPLGKVPVFEGADGFTLYESSAIAHYIASSKEGTSLLGKNKKEAALIAQFVSFADNEFNPVMAAWIYPILGYVPFNAAATNKAKEDSKRALDAINKHLATRTFLVGESVTLADIVLTCSILTLYKSVFDPSFVGPYKNVTRWFTTCVNQPHFKAVLGEVKLCEKMQEYVPPKETPKPKEQPAKQAKPAKEEDLEALAAAEQAGSKEKNPLDLLPKSSFILDEWKRFYSNNDTRPTAIDWFWKNYDSEGYSIWKVKYKYNNELTQIFMSSNLVGGFFQRLERARKYAFGSVLVLGVDGKNEIEGVFVFRGKDIPFEVRDAADFESYDFSRLDEKDPKAREHFNAIIAWDEKINGKPCADGKTFK